METINKEQIINETATEIIKNHLQWSNSLDSKPSDTVGCSAPLFKMVNKVDIKECENFEDVGKDMWEKAKALADEKWQAVITIIGI